MTAQQIDRAAFMTATRGIPDWTVAKALSRLTPGIDWRGCSRGHMADVWSKAKHGIITHYPMSLANVTLDMLYQLLRAD